MDTNYTMVAKLAKRYLPGNPTAYGGAHGRLKEVGSAYRSERL